MGGLVILGDSHAAGLGPHSGGARVISRRGWSTGGYSRDETWQAAIKAAAPAAVWIVLGTNDGPSSQAAYQEQVQGVALEVGRMAPGASLLWIGPPTVTRATLAPLLDSAAIWQRQALGQIGVPWWDSRPATAAAEHAPDGVHFTGKGYRAWIDAIKAASGGGGRGGLGWLVAAAAAALGLAWTSGRKGNR